MGFRAWTTRARLSAGLGHPFGLVLLAVSILGAAGLRTVPALEPWAERAGWIAVLGVLAYIAASLAAAWPMPAPIISEPPAADPARRGALRPAAGPYPDGLTRREVEVLCLLAEGNANKEIARRLVLTVPSVESHVAHIYGKINARNRVSAAAYAAKHGLCQAPPGPPAT